MALQVKSGETILFIGDSITDCGRRGAERPLGNGYVRLFSDMLAIREPQKRVKIINKGISGDRVTWLRARWTDDAMRCKPDWLSVMIGINDLHSVLNARPDPVPLKLYEEEYDDILARTRSAFPKCRILLIDPFYMSVERSPNSPRRQALDSLAGYIRIVHNLSRKYHTRLVRMHDRFQQLLKHHPADMFCPEPVHPNLTGHLAIALEVYEALSH